MARSAFTPQQSGRSTPIPEDGIKINKASSKSQLQGRSHSGSNSTTFVAGQGFIPNNGLGDPRDIAELNPPPLAYYNNNMKAPSFSKVKLKSLKKKSSLDTPPVDLTKSISEQEGLGSSNARRGIHTRTSSNVSQMSALTTISTWNGPHYPRQGQTYTPPMSRSRSRADSGDDLYSQSYAPLPTSTRTPPPLHIRTHSTSSGIKSPSQTHLDNPTSATSLQGETFSPDSMGRSGRSSFDSVFRRRARVNTDDDRMAQAAIAREQWHLREATKQRKREEDDARTREKEERRAEKLAEYGRRRDDQKRSRANTITTMASNEKDSGVAAINYAHTRPMLPVDKELDMIRAGKRPPHNRTPTSSSFKKKARGTKNAFEKFFYDLYTAWLKLLHGVGFKKSS